MILGLDIRAPLDRRQEDRGARSSRRDVEEHQPPAMVGDDLVRYRQPEPGAAVAGLRREERLERTAGVSR
jgi:hypothetical protein